MEIAQELIDIAIRHENLHGILYTPKLIPLSAGFSSPNSSSGQTNRFNVPPYPLVLHINGMPGSSPEEDQKRFAEHFIERGVAFFAYDHLGVRESSGIFTYFGAQSNIERVIDTLVHHPLVDPTRIGLLGESFGGAMAICHAARDSRVRCLAVRSPVFDTELIPTYPFFDDLLKIWTRNNQMRFPEGNHLKEVYIQQTRQYNPRNMAHLIHQPLYMVAGGRDELLPAEGFDQLFANIGSERKQIHTFPKANHNFSYEKDFQGMRDLFGAFFSKEMISKNEYFP